MKAKQKAHEVWAEFTYGAWYLPYIPSKEQKSYNRRATGTLWKCDKCDRVYDYNNWGKRVNYYIDMPKRQKIKTCQMCDGKTDKCNFI